MDEFVRVYGGLNKRQLEAVQQIDGPVLVIAGPGTGKTQLLSARVSNILKTTDTQPQNILCLTFTNKAAINMKSRIIDQVGGTGAKVVASTFHSFAAEIMNLYPDNFWNAAKLSVAPDAVQLEALESIVRELPLDNPLALKFAGQYTLLSDAQQAINQAKKAGLTPEKLRSIIAYNLAYLDDIEEQMTDILKQRLSAKSLQSLQNKISKLTSQPIDKLVYPLTSLSTVISDSLAQAIAQDADSGKTLNTGKWKARWVQTVNGHRGMLKERERNGWWLELANVYESYREVLHGRGFYDYDDMLVEVNSQLEQNSGMLADIQERFNYVLIDEFQDTTPAHLRLAHLVADHHTSESKPNLMAVGDDDQAIFKFNGAELNNMLGFKREYPTAKIIILTDNYRSTQAILDTAKRIIEQAESRMINADPALSKNLLAKAPPKAKGAVIATAFSSRELQLSQVARDIQKNYKPPLEIAVLARSHDSLIKMAGLLQNLNIPVRYEQSRNTLDHEIINQTYLSLKLLLAIQNGDKEGANSLIHQIIRWPAWEIEPRQLWDLAVNRAGKSWLDALLFSHSPDLKAMGNWFVWLAKQCEAQPLAVTIEQIVGLRPSGEFTSPIKDYLVSSAGSGVNDYLHGLSAIQLLQTLVQEFAVDSEPTIAEFARFIEINEENKVVVADESPFITGAHAIQLLTVHKAKGLEFDHVYIIDAVDSNWQPKSSRRKPPANLPLQPPLDDFDDYVRLMYVAATRAKSSLSISAYYLDHSGKDVATSTIIQSAMTIEKVSEDGKQKLITVLEENLRWPDLSGGQEKEMLRARLEDYNLYATHLLNFVDVSRGGPQYFKERNLVYLPEPKTASLSYGTAMHAALEHAQQLSNRGSFSLTEVESKFGKALKQEQQTKLDYERYLVQGKATLSRLFNDFDYKLPKGSLTEQRIKDVRLEDARIGGTLDRLDRTGDGVTIIDYKTGNPLSSFDSKDKSKAIRVYRHKLQLIFYALLMSEYSNLELGKISSRIVYVESATAKGLERSYVPTAEDIDRMRRLIATVWRRIMNLDLPDISRYSKDIEGIKAFEDDLLK